MIDTRAVQDFYTNQALRDAVRAYIEECFKVEAVEMVFRREDVSHIADARDLLDRAFNQMEVDFKVTKPVNTLAPR